MISGPAEALSKEREALLMMASTLKVATAFTFEILDRQVVQAGTNDPELRALAARAIGHTLGIPFLHVQTVGPSQFLDPTPSIIGIAQARRAVNLRIGVHDGASGVEEFSLAETPNNALGTETFQPLESPITTTTSRALTGLVWTLQGR